MSFYLTALSKDDPATVMVGRMQMGDEYLAVALLCPPTLRTNVDDACVRAAYGNKPLEIQIVDSQGRMAMIFLEERAGWLYLKGNIAVGQLLLEPVENGKVPLFSHRRRVGLHLRSDGTLIIRALDSFKWLVDGKRTEEVWVDLPAFKQASQKRDS
jgi:hypothetical protein